MKVFKANFKTENPGLATSMKYLKDVFTDAVTLANLVNDGENMQEIIDEEFTCNCGFCSPEERTLFLELIETLALRILGNSKPSREEWEEYATRINEACKNPVIRRFYERIEVGPIMRFLAQMSILIMDKMQEEELCLKHYQEKYGNLFNLSNTIFNNIVNEMVTTASEGTQPTSEMYDRWHDAIQAFLTKEVSSVTMSDN